MGDWRKQYDRYFQIKEEKKAIEKHEDAKMIKNWRYTS